MPHAGLHVVQLFPEPPALSSLHLHAGLADVSVPEFLTHFALFCDEIANIVSF